MGNHYVAIPDNVELPDLFDEDDEVRELTAEETKLFRPLSELPEEHQAMLRALKRPAAEKQQVALSPDVLAPFRARGEHWESLVEGALREWLRDHAA